VVAVEVVVLCMSCGKGCGTGAGAGAQEILNCLSRNQKILDGGAGA